MASFDSVRGWVPRNLIDDDTISTTTTWSSQKIVDTEFDHGDILDDDQVSSTMTWSSSKIDAELQNIDPSDVIDDNATATSTTWSSQKIDAELQNIDVSAVIDDNATATSTTWSSQKIDAELQNIDPSDVIDDVATATSTTWSSQKVSEELDTKQDKFTDDIDITETVDGAITRLELETNNRAQLSLISNDDLSHILLKTMHNELRIRCEQYVIGFQVGTGSNFLQYQPSNGQVYFNAPVFGEDGYKIPQIRDDLQESTETWSSEKIATEIANSQSSTTIDGIASNPTTPTNALTNILMSGSGSFSGSTTRMLIIASSNGFCMNPRSAIMACNNSEILGHIAGGQQCSIIGSTACKIDADWRCNSIFNSMECEIITGGAHRAIVSSTRVRAGSGNQHSLIMGYASTGDPSTNNQTIRLEADGGVGRFEGGTTTSGFDYAELCPNLEHGRIPAGTIVVFEGDKVRPATAADKGKPLFTITATAGVVGNSREFCWQGRYLRNEFGEYLRDEDGEKIENPEYDSTRTYIPRAERPEEWSTVAFVGQVLTRVYEDITPGAYVGPDGKACRLRTNLMCLKMNRKFDAAKGYGVALCLLR